MTFVILQNGHSIQIETAPMGRHSRKHPHGNKKTRVPKIGKRVLVSAFSNKISIKFYSVFIFLLKNLNIFSETLPKLR